SNTATDNPKWYDPLENYTPEYEDTKSKLMAEYSVEKAKVDSLKNKAVERDRNDALTKSGELVDDGGFMGAINPDYKYSPYTINRKINQLYEKGFNTEEEIDSELLKMGVSTKGIQRAKDWAATDDRTGGHIKGFKDFMDMGAAIAGIHPEQLKDKAESLAMGAGAMGQGFLGLGNMILGAMDIPGGKERQEWLNKNRAVFDSYEANWESNNKGSWNVPYLVGKYSADIASIPLAGSKLLGTLALAGTGAASTQAQGYSPIQTSAMTALGMVVGGAVDKAVNLWKKGTKVIGDAESIIRADLKMNEAEWNAAKELWGETVKKGNDARETLNNFLMYTLARKDLKVSHESDELFRKTQDNIHRFRYNTQYYKKSITDRATPILKDARKGTPLGDIIHRNTHRGDGLAGINWSSVADELVSQPLSSAGGKFNLNTPVIKQILKNSEVYGDSDFSMAKMLSDPMFKHSTEPSTIQELKTIASEGIKQQAIKHLAQALQINVINRVSSVARAVDFIWRRTPASRRDRVVRNFIEEQLKKGTPFSPRTIEDDLRDFDPMFAKMGDEELSIVGRAVIQASMHTDLSAREAKLSKLQKELALSSKEADIEVDNLKGDLARLEADRVKAKRDGDTGLVKQLTKNIAEKRDDITVAQGERIPARASNKEMVTKATRISRTDKGEYDPVTEGYKTAKKEGMIGAGLGNPKPQAKSNNAIEPSNNPQAKSMEPAKTTQQGNIMVEKMANDLGTQESRDALRAVRDTYFPKVFGKDMHDEFLDLTKKAKDEGKKFTPSKFLNDKIWEGTVEPEDVLKYYLKNPSFSTKTDLSFNDMLGKAGMSKPLIKTLNDLGYNEGSIVSYMQQHRGITRAEAIKAILGIGTAAIATLKGTAEKKTSNIITEGISRTIKDTEVEDIVKHLKDKSKMAMYHNNKIITLEKKPNGTVVVDSSRLDKSVDKGGRAYLKIFEAIDKLGLKYDTSGVGLSERRAIGKRLQQYQKDTG
ncbi:MAG: hypothetical protein JHC33_09070, partial [Ignisphaera sp.]|nr:hypothetical protein [Ignisphaera sp.]